MIPINSRMKPVSTMLSLTVAALALSACVSFGSKPPPQLLTVTADSVLESGKSIRSEGLPTIAVIAPDVPRKLETMRVPVQVDSTTVAYVKDAQWTEAPRSMFQRLLSETIAAGGDIFVIGEEQYGLSPGRRLTGELVDFGIDAETQEAVVTFDAVITTRDGNGALRQRFTTREPVSNISAKRVAKPINSAANKVASDVAAWVKAN